MARGRFISNAIMSDKKINELIDDTSRLAFTWLITTADVEGRTHGDPAMVRSLLFPRRDDVTLEQMEAYIADWHRLGLVHWYKSNGDLWIEFPNFEKYQVGLRKEREPESQIPPLSDGELLPIESDSVGCDPANIRQTSGTNKDKLREDKVKRSEGNKAAKPPTPAPIETYRKVARKYPNKALWDNIAQTVTDCDLWERVITGYIALGWNPSNIAGMLEFYGRGEVPHSNGKNGNGHKPVNGMLEAIRLAQQESGYGDE